MATITKRRWHTSAGQPREAWLLAYTDAEGKRHKSQHSTRRAADAARIAAEGKVATGQYRPEADKHTVRDACDDYLDHLEARHERDAHVTTTYLATVRSELAYACPEMISKEQAEKRNRATPFKVTEGIGAVRLSKLTTRTVADLTDRMLTAGVSVSATRRTVASLARALDYARRRDMIAANPARGVKVVGRRDEGPKKIVPPARATMLDLKKAAAPDVWLRLQFAASTGLRASEQWALRWRHLDLDVGYVHVETRVDRHGVFDTTKSAAGRRSVPLGGALVEALKKWRGETAFSADDDLVFPVVVKRKAGDRQATQNHKNFYDRTFIPLVRQVGAGGDFNWHSLRHFAISSWIDAGLQPKTVQTYAGHATLAITMDRYGHLFPSDSHHAAMDAVAGALA